MWLVKLKRTGFETVIDSWSERLYAETHARVLNEKYQTDEYYVEEFDPEKVEGFNA